MRIQMIDKKYTYLLSQFVTRLQYKALSKKTIERTKDLIIDHLGVTLYGSQLEWSEKVRRLSINEMGKKESTIYGFGKVTARAAALANGTAAHAAEFDDTHDESLGHPGAVIIPAAMAIAEKNNSSGSELLTAIIAGYEVQCRVGSTVGRQLIERGFHPTSVVGVFGSCASAGKLLNLTTKQFESAFGSSASMCGGVMQFSEDPVNTMIKRLHAGLPSERGILAAQLSSIGFTGPNGAIEGQFGFAKVFTGVDQLNRITLDLGKKFEVDVISVKIYPCCKQFHALIEAIDLCKKQNPFRPQDIQLIEPFGPSAMINAHMEKRPASMMAAQYSLPYVTAVAILLDPTLPSSYDLISIKNKELLKISDLVIPHIDKKLQPLYPKKFPAGVRILLKNGTILTATVLDSKGTQNNIITREEIVNKFHALTNNIYAKRKRNKIIDTVLNIDKAKSIGNLTSILKI